MVMETPNGKKVILEEAKLPVCSACSKRYGEPEVVVEPCDAGCGEYFSVGEKIICCGSFHYHKECFAERRKKR